MALRFKHAALLHEARVAYGLRERFFDSYMHLNLVLCFIVFRVTSQGILCFLVNLLSVMLNYCRRTRRDVVASRRDQK